MSTTERLVTEAVLAPVLSPVSLARPLAPGPSSGLRRALMGLDIVGALGGWILGLALTDAVRGSAQPLPAFFSVATMLAACTILLVAGHRLYLARTCTIRSVEIGRLFRSSAGAGVVALVLPRFLPIDVRVSGAGLGVFLSFMFLMTGRGLYRHWLQVGRREGRFMRPIVIVGGNDEAYDVYRLLKDHPELGFKVTGVVADPTDVLPREGGVPCLGGFADAANSVKRAGATGVIVAATAVPPEHLNRLIRTFLSTGVHVHLSSGLRGIDHRRVRSMPLAHEPLFYLEPLTLAPWQVAIKRTIDLVGSILGGIGVLPVIALAALAIKLQDRGPVFYRQRRVGLHGRIFTIIKLRTMVPQAEQMYGELARTMAGRDGPLIKLNDDPRRTLVGRVLERLSIDELPQLVNVIKGEMSLVGPRPAQPSEVEAFDDELRGRDAVRPGLTGLWQVEARDNPSFRAYRRYDLFYIENWSVTLDIAILIATLQRVFFRGVDLLAGPRKVDAVTPALTPVPSVVTEG